MSLPTEVTNPLYRQPLSNVHINGLFTVKDDHEYEDAGCLFCEGTSFPPDAMIVTFTEEKPDEEDRPGSPGPGPAADGSQPVPIPWGQPDFDPLADLERVRRLFAERDRYIAGAVGHRDHGHADRDDLEPELDPERVVHSIDEPEHQPHSYDDAVAYAHLVFAQRLARTRFFDGTA